MTFDYNDPDAERMAILAENASWQALNATVDRLADAVRAAYRQLENTGRMHDANHNAKWTQAALDTLAAAIRGGD